MRDRTKYAARWACRVWLSLVTIVCAGCVVQPVTSSLFADWAMQQSEIENRVAITCASLQAGTGTKHHPAILRDHMLRVGHLSTLLAQEEESAGAIQISCSKVKSCIENAKETQASLDALIAPQGCARECADAVTKVIGDAKRAKKMPPTSGLLGMIAATGGENLDALIKAAHHLAFARAAVYGLVQSADSADALVDEVAEAFGAFTPLAQPVLRKVAASLIALGVDDVVARIEKKNHHSGVALAERACDAAADLTVRSMTARTVLQRVILRFDEKSFDETTGLSYACKAISNDNSLKSCQRALDETTKGQPDGHALVAPGTTDQDADAERSWSLTESRINALQATPPKTLGPSEESGAALRIVAKACHEQHGFGAGECSADRLASVVTYYEDFILTAPPASISVKSLVEGALRIEAKANLAEEVSRNEAKVDSTEGASLLEAKVDRVTALVSKLDKNVEFTHDLVQKGFNDLLNCRAILERRDVLAAVFGYRPLSPCTRKNQASSFISKGLSPKPISRREICDEKRLTIAMRVSFPQGKFSLNDIDTRTVKQLEALADVVKSLDPGLQALNVRGIADQISVKSELCETMKREIPLNVSGAPKTSRWQCEDPIWPEGKSASLNKALGWLRARTVCGILGKQCSVDGQQQTTTEVQIELASQDLELPTECIVDTK